jgi:hypothetical protein
MAKEKRWKREKVYDVKLEVLVRKNILKYVQRKTKEKQ